MNERIKKLRKALDLTQQEFADRIGVKRNTIATYEIGRNTPLDAVISSICREFSVSEAWLRTGEGEMFLPLPNGILDELAQKYGLSLRSKAIIGKFLELKPNVQEAIVGYIEQIAAAFSDSGTAMLTQDSTPAHTLTIEEEARAEANQQAQLIYQQILSEKRAEAEGSSGFSVPEAGGGTAKHA